MTQDTVQAGPESFQDLQSLAAWLTGQRDKIKGLVGEIEQVQQAFTARLVDAREGLDDAAFALQAALDAAGQSLAPWVTKRLTDGLGDMRAAKGKRLEELRSRVQTLETERSAIEEKSAAERQTLAAANPELNAREEQLKTERASQEAEIQRIDAELATAAAGLGWLLRAGKIYELRAVRHRWETALHGTASRLNEVRQTWNTKQVAVEKDETAAQSDWRAKTTELAALSGELDSLQRDFEGTCRTALIQKLAAEVTEFEPTGSEAGDESLQAVLALKAEAADLEGGVKAVAEILGTLKGLQEGVVRFKHSVDGVKKEQDMHAELAHLKLAAPPEVISFHQLWDELTPVVADEKTAAEHPAELAARLGEVIGSRLDETGIAAMFEALGNCLNEATKAQWG